nr:T cell receptor beta [Andrias davidianus]
MDYMLTLLASLSLVSCVRPQTISQGPRSVVEPEGGPASLHCTVVGASSPYLYWYRQSPSAAGMQLVSYSVGMGVPAVNNLQHFTAERPEDLTFTLQTGSLMVNDTAVYFCAWSREQLNTPLYFGQGTKLTVLEDGIPKTSPTVVLFDPSPQEIKDKGKATLVCLANKFYPDHVTMGWSVNGVERTAGVKTDDSPTRDNASMYFLSSRLRLSKKEWLNPQNTFRCTVHFHSPEASIPEYRETKGREECGMTPDSFRKSANTGKFTYVLLLAKSAFYGLFVTLLVWKMKPPGEKQLF